MLDDNDKENSSVIKRPRRGIAVRIFSWLEKRKKRNEIDLHLVYAQSNWTIGRTNQSFSWTRIESWFSRRSFAVISLAEMSKSKTSRSRLYQSFNCKNETKPKLFFILTKTFRLVDWCFERCLRIGDWKFTYHRLSLSVWIRRWTYSIGSKSLHTDSSVRRILS